MGTRLRECGAFLKNIIRNFKAKRGVIEAPSATRECQRKFGAIFFLSLIKRNKKKMKKRGKNFNSTSFSCKRGKKKRCRLFGKKKKRNMNHSIHLIQVCSHRYSSNWRRGEREKCKAANNRRPFESNGILNAFGLSLITN